MCTHTRFINAGRSKIYDDAMAWILFGFIELPFLATYLTVTFAWGGYGVASFGVWSALWKRQLQVWDSL